MSDRSFPIPTAQAPAVLIGGAGGLIGGALGDSLRRAGWRVLRLRRGGPAGPDDIPWNPTAGDLDASRLEGLDAVVHLGGASIAGGRWTDARKRMLRDSRVLGAELLARSLARCDAPPPVWLCASAVGIYGHRPGERLDESAYPGAGFLADLAREWEEAALGAPLPDLRRVAMRIGLVLSGQGGALPRMLPAFRLGLGGPQGDGAQPLSWITLTDTVAAIRFCLERADMAGPVNFTAPQAVTQAEFARALGRALRRPARIRAPAFLLRGILGEMADLLLEGAHAEPWRLQEAGFRWRHPDLDTAFADILR